MGARIPNGIGVAESGVEPQFQLRETLLQRAHDRRVVAAALDCVKVGDIERPERMQPEQRLDNGNRVAPAAERTLQRPIRAAVAAARVHHMPSHQIDNRN